MIINDSWMEEIRNALVNRICITESYKTINVGNLEPQRKNGLVSERQMATYFYDMAVNGVFPRSKPNKRQ